MRRSPTRWPERAALRIACAAGLALASLGCAGPESRVLRVAQRNPVENLDPQLTEDTATLALLSNVYEPLVALDAELRLVPALARAWTNPNDLTWRFELRRGVVFHDGHRFSARDVEHTFERGLADPRSWIRSRVPLLAEVRAVDEYTVELVTRAPAALLLRALAEILILPAGARELGTSAQGTGPWRLVRFTPGHEVVLERGARLARRFDRAVLRPEAEGRARVRSVLLGEADLAEFPPVESLPEVAASPRGQVLEFPSLRLSLLGLRVLPEASNPFSDPELRRALALALDRRALIRDAFAGRARPATQLSPAGLFGFVPELSYQELDAKAARAALARSRHPNGVSVALEFSERDRTLARLVAVQAAAAKIHFELRELPWEELDRRLQSRASPASLFQMSYFNGDTADVLSEGLHTQSADRRYGMLNFSGYSNRELDALLEASETELDSQRRYTLLRRAMEIGVEARVWLPLCAPSALYVARRGIHWSGNPAGRLRLDEIEAQ